jgi:SAM-dependent methyltransferase
MNWLAKCVAFQVLERMPGGQSFYHFMQRRVTRSTLQTEERLLGKIEQTARYWRWLTANTSPPWLAQASHLDLGAGWLPSVPITFFGLGTPRQYLVDLSPHMTAEAVLDTADKFRRAAPRASIPIKRLPPELPRGLSLQSTLEPLGMIYSAPYDQLADELAGKVGFVTATTMLCHLNRPTLVQVFRSVHRLLQPGGFFLAQHYLRQLFDGLESKTSPFFFLRYSEWFWENIVNSKMMSYNRLRAPDFREALQEAGFEIAGFEVEPGTPEEFALLERARIHPMFRKYSREELAARFLFLAARKPC